MALIGATMRSPRPDFRKPPSASVVFGSLAIVAALGGLFLIVQTALTTTPVVALGTEARGDTLSLWINNSEVLDHEHASSSDDGHDHDHGDEGGVADGTQSGVEALSDLTAQTDTDSQGFAMPASMMPGTPEDGFQRLQLELDFSNRSGASATVAPQDFFLLSNEGERWGPLLGGTFHQTDLRSQQVLSTVVAFDIPVRVAASDVQFVWTGDGDEIRFAVDAEGGHSHG